MLRMESRERYYGDSIGYEQRYLFSRRQDLFFSMILPKAKEV
jgi:hypothetical protein